MTENYKGKFITFEGPDGSGKTTQINLVYEYLKSKGYPCICTREPGGTKIGEKLRDILKNPELNSLLSMQTEALLLQTARAQHVFELIKPSLKEGKIVLCDRYADSSTAYQGAGRELGEDVIEYLNNFATTGLTPDLTLILDLSPEEGLKRADDREHGQEKDRWEAQKISFHKKVRSCFLGMAERNPDRYKIVAADQKIEDIQKDIIAIIKNEFNV